MSDEGIWLVGSDGGLVPMEPSSPQNEDELQTLIARHREVIAGEGEALLLVRREQGIAGGEEGGGRWSLDHLFVTRDAIPVLVEVKRASDTRIRREVVAQMLDYAANGVRYWSAGAAQASFEHTCRENGADPIEGLAEFLGPEADEQAAGFWERMEQNMRDGRLKMVFVADRVPDELATIVEFLNEHTRDHIEVRAVELRHFEGKGGLLTLVRRVVGETAKMKIAKRRTGPLPPITIEEWLDKCLGSDGAPARKGAEAWLRIMEELGAETKVSVKQKSISGSVKTSAGKACYLTYLMGNGKVSIEFGTMREHPALKDENTRTLLLKKFKTAVGELGPENPNGYPNFDVKFLNDSDKASKFKNVFAYLLKAVLSESESDFPT